MSSTDRKFFSVFFIALVLLCVFKLTAQVPSDEIHEVSGPTSIATKFVHDDKAYLELGDGSYWWIPTQPQEGSVGWWGSIHGDPSARWMRGDFIVWSRAEEGEYPVLMTNTTLGETAPAVQVHFSLQQEQKWSERLDKLEKRVRRLQRRHER